MRFTDLVTGLAFVAGHVGLAQLDSGLRSGIEIPLEELQSHVQLVTRSAQATMLTGQIDQLRGKANKLQKQQLNAEHAQLMVQIGQLQLQLQQYQVERKRLELEVKKETRLAQENQLLRIFVDLFNQAQIYRQTAQYLDFIFVVAASYRIYRQVYNDLDDARNRLQIAELRERLLVGARDVMGQAEARRDMANAFVAAVQEPVGLIARGQQAMNEAGAAMQESQSLRMTPDSEHWLQSIEQSDVYYQRLRNARQRMNQVFEDHAAFTEGGDIRELFLSADSGGMAEFVASLGVDWAEWRSLVALKLGRPIDRVVSDLVAEPKVLEVKAHEVVRSEQEVTDLRLSHELGLVVTQQKEFFAHHQQVYTDTKDEFDQTPVPPGEQDPVVVFQSHLALRRLECRLEDRSEAFLDFVDTDRHLSDKGYVAAATNRLHYIGAIESGTLPQQAADMLGLSSSIQNLQAGIDRSQKLCKDLLDKAVDNEAVFLRIREAAQEALTDDMVRSTEVELAGTPPSMGARLKGLFRNDHGKEVDQRRRLLATLIDRAVSEVEPDATPQPPRLPDLPADKSRGSSTRR